MIHTNIIDNFLDKAWLSEMNGFLLYDLSESGRPEKQKHLPRLVVKMM
jgi:hypothetical protein